jgi:hypothetical protein
VAGKLLNLDMLLPERVSVLLDGIEHEIRAQSVESWLQLMKEREMIEGMVGPNEGSVTQEQAVKMVELQINIAHTACPSIPAERLRQLPINVLAKLVELIGEQMGVAAGVPTGSAEAEGEAPAADEMSPSTSSAS